MLPLLLLPLLLPTLLQACADKLDRDLQQYGCPPKFPTEDEEMEEAAAAPQQLAAAAVSKC